MHCETGKLISQVNSALFSEYMQILLLESTNIDVIVTSHTRNYTILYCPRLSNKTEQTENFQIMDHLFILFIDNSVICFIASIQSTFDISVEVDLKFLISQCKFSVHRI